MKQVARSRKQRENGQVEITKTDDRKKRIKGKSINTTCISSRLKSKNKRFSGKIRMCT
jgi:hypothetical protein